MRKLIVAKEYTVQEIFDAIDAAYKHRQQYPGIPFIFDGESGLGFGSIKMLNFRFNGVICKHCNIKGSIFRKEKQGDAKYYHLNLYAVDPKTKALILMTRDHIIPTSKGGLNTLENSQPLCSNCNNLKDNLLPEEFNYKCKYNKHIVNKHKLNWDRWRRRLKFFFYTSLENRKIVFPKCVGEQRSSIKSFWKY